MVVLVRRAGFSPVSVFGDGCVGKGGGGGLTVVSLDSPATVGAVNGYS